MKSTGTVRKVDELGRIVIPKEIRNILDINVGDSLEIYTENNGDIVLRKFQRGCVFCGEVNSAEILNFKGKIVCKKCLKDALK